jgi:hypothetical protein
MILNFEDELGKTHFEFCFVGFILGGSLPSVNTKGMTILRRELAIFEKMEAISDPKKCGKKMANGEPERQLKTDGSRQLRLESAEFDMLYNYMSEVPWQTGTPVRNALETIDWLLKSEKAGK